MTYQLQIIERPTYLHAIVTGPNTVENVAGYLQDMLRECEARQCFNVLIEERLTGRRLETWDVYQIASSSAVQTPIGGGISMSRVVRSSLTRRILARSRNVRAYTPGVPGTRACRWAMFPVVLSRQPSG